MPLASVKSNNDLLHQTPSYVYETLSYYDDAGADYILASKDTDLTECYGRFTSYLPANASVLDAGCGSGRDSRWFLGQGYQVESIDGSVSMCMLASQLQKIRIRLLTFDRIEYEDRFDGIWSSASLIHISADDQAGIYDRLHRALRPNGVLFVNYNLGNGERFEAGRRLHFDHNELSFRRFIESHSKFEIADLWISGDSKRPDINWINAILRAV